MLTSSTLLPLATLLGLATANIDRVDFLGSGCPQGTVGNANTGELQATLIFDAYNTEVAIPDLDCSIDVTFTVPDGWTGSTLTTKIRGTTVLAAAGAQAVLSSSGGGKTIDGPSNGDFQQDETSSVAGAGGTTLTVTLTTALTLGGTLSDSDTASVFSIEFAFASRA